VTAAGGIVLWDVDTQVDFMLPHGLLYVPGAEEAATNMGVLVKWARDAGVVHVASADDHEADDPELSTTPDFESTYPSHCLRGTVGAQKIPETAQQDPVVLPHDPLPAQVVASLIAGRREILVPKKRFDVFTNPNTDPLVAALDPQEVIVFGVATDVCDHAAVMGLLDRGRRVAFVEDAARGLSAERVAACTATWRDRGVRFTTTAEVAAAPDAA
jgi:nicotinamidase/pyrazinamidase